MLLRTICALFLVVAAASAAAQTSDPIVDHVITLAKDKAVNASKPDWTAVEKNAASLLQNTPGEAGRTAAIRHVLSSLADNHSFYRPPTANKPDGQTSTGPVRSHARPPIAMLEVGNGEFSRLSINAWIGGNDAVRGATEEVRRELSKALAASNCGLILDVSKNSGGNMWPMMGGIAPLYDEGVIETFEKRDGERRDVNIRNGVLHMGSNAFPQVPLPLIEPKPRYIAVILGKRTMSSGEILALGFKGQGNVRFFGSPTAGATTANTTFPLANGGLLALTTARILDRSGTVHQGPVLPDVVSDEPLGSASAWLAEQCRH